MEEPLSMNELHSELTGLNKGEKEQKKKQLILGVIIGILLFAIIIIIIIITSKSNKKDDIDDDDIPTMPVIGEINCLYEIQTINRDTQLLSDEFNKNSNFDIYINNKRNKYSKKYKFDKTGNHIIQIKLYEGINMDYMFKGIDELIAVEMKSDKNCQISSMISTFENCGNLYKFNIEGFNAVNIKSMKKIFYKTSLTEYNFSSFNSTNLEDISCLICFILVL